MSHDLVDRLYRGLFVYSVGFYEMLQKSLRGCKQKHILIAQIWKVYSVLLEFCCKSNYQLMISKVTEQHNTQISQLQDDYAKEITQFIENQKTLKLALDDMQKKQTELEKQKEEEVETRKIIEEEFNKNIKNHEEEVQLRLRFESKLNHMHALHRDLQTKYERAIEEIYKYQESYAQLQEENSEMETELIQLRELKLKQESELKMQADLIKQQATDLDLRERSINDLDVKLQQLRREAEVKDSKLSENKQTISDLQLNLEMTQSQLKALTSEKSHLDVRLAEVETQNEQLLLKLQRTEKELNQTTSELQDAKRQLVGIDEVKKDRDERIAKLRQEIQELTDKFEALQHEHISLNVRHNQLSEDHEIMSEQFKDTTKQLLQSTTQNKEHQETLKDQTEQLSLLKEEISFKEDHIERLKTEISKQAKRISEVEKSNDTLEIKKKSIEKQSEIQRKQLLEKIKNLEETVGQEKDSREMWITRYEQEQKLHIQTTNELVKVKQREQELEMDTKNQAINELSIQKKNERLEEQITDLNTQNSQQVQEIEQLKRELTTKLELLKVVEDQHCNYVRRLREEYHKLEQKQEKVLFQRDIEYEDLYSLSHAYFTQINSLKQEVKELEESIIVVKKQVEQKDRDIGVKQIVYEQLHTKYTESEEQNLLKDQELKENLIKIVNLEEDLKIWEGKGKEMEEQEKVLRKLREELRRTKEELAIVSEKLKQETYQPVPVAKTPKNEEEGEEEEEEDVVVEVKGKMMNRGVQVKISKKKTQETQTDIMPFPMPMPFNMFQTAQLPQSVNTSANFAQKQDPKRPRVQSAANPQFVGHQKFRQNQVNAQTGSEGVTSTYANSHGDIGLIDFNANIMGSGGLSGLSEFPREGHLGTVASKYAAPAIAEESMQDNTRFVEGQDLKDYHTVVPTAMQRHQIAFKNQNGHMMLRKHGHTKDPSKVSTDNQETLKSVYNSQLSNSTRPMTQPNRQRNSLIRPTGSGLQGTGVMGSPKESNNIRVDMGSIPSSTNLTSHPQGSLRPNSQQRPITKGSRRTNIKQLIKVASSREN